MKKANSNVKPLDGGPIYVSRPVLPNFDTFVEELRKIWERRQLSNFGPEYLQFTKELCRFLCTTNIEIVSNGTVALFQILKVLNLKPGEIITTAFTFPATSHAIALAGHRPIYSDVDVNTLNLDPVEVEKKINSKTRAILPVHVFGNPCDVDQFEALGRKYQVPVIYDAAHTLAVNFRGKPLATYGDFSMISLHATKILHSLEGGVIYFKDSQWGESIKRWSNFGLDPEGFARSVGFNSKMNEICALMGRLMIETLNDQIIHRKRATELYDSLLEKWFERAIFRKVTSLEIEQKNYQYYPILIESREGECTAQKMFLFLKERNVLARRYFYPLCTSVEEFRHGQNIPISEKASTSILCLPLYGDIPLECIERTCFEIEKFMKESSQC